MPLNQTNPQMGTMPQAHINIRPEDAKPMICEAEDCECDTYIQIFKLSKISKLLTGQSEDLIMQVVELACQACGHILKD